MANNATGFEIFLNPKLVEGINTIDDALNKLKNTIKDFPDVNVKINIPKDSKKSIEELANSIEKISNKLKDKNISFDANTDPFKQKLDEVMGYIDAFNKKVLESKQNTDLTSVASNVVGDVVTQASEAKKAVESVAKAAASAMKPTETKSEKKSLDEQIEAHNKKIALLEKQKDKVFEVVQAEKQALRERQRELQKEQDELEDVLHGLNTKQPVSWDGGGVTELLQAIAKVKQEIKDIRDVSFSQVDEKFASKFDKIDAHIDTEELKILELEIQKVDEAFAKLAKSKEAYRGNGSLTDEAQKLVDTKARLQEEYRLRTQTIKDVQREQEKADKEAAKERARIAKEEEREEKRRAKEAAQEAKRQAREQAKAEALAKKEAEKQAFFKEINTSDDGVQDSINNTIEIGRQAKNVRQLEESIKQLKAARDRLNITDAKSYEQLRRLNVEIANQEKRMKSLQNHKGFNALANQIKGVGRAVLAAYSLDSLEAFLGQLYKIRGEFEMQQVALTAIIKKKYLADQVWDKVVKLAVQSPFTVKDLVTYTKQMAAYQIEADKLYDTTKMLADVSAGLGVDMGRLILAYGQIKAANFLRASEVRQLTEAGVDVYGELAKHLTDTRGRLYEVSEVIDMTQKRLITFKDVEAVFKNLTGASGEFYNMQQIQAETLQGMVSNLRDSVDLMFNDIGKQTEPLLKFFVKFFKFLTSNWEFTFAGILGVGAAIIGKMIPALRQGIQFMKAFNKAATASMGKNLASLVSKSGKIGLIIAAVGSIVALISTIVKKTKQQKEEINSLYEHYGKLNNEVEIVASTIDKLGDKKLKFGDIDDQESLKNITQSVREIEKNIPAFRGKIKIDKESTLEEIAAQMAEVQEYISYQTTISESVAKKSQKVNDLTQKRVDLLRQLKTAASQVQVQINQAQQKAIKNDDGFSDSDEDYKKQKEKVLGYVKDLQNAIDSGNLDWEAAKIFIVNIQNATKELGKFSDEFNSITPDSTGLYQRLAGVFYTTDSAITTAIQSAINDAYNYAIQNASDPEKVNRHLSLMFKSAKVEESALSPIANMINFKLSQALGEETFKVKLSYNIEDLKIDQHWQKVVKEEIKRLKENGWANVDLSALVGITSYEKLEEAQSAIKKLADEYENLVRVQKAYAADRKTGSGLEDVVNSSVSDKEKQLQAAQSIEKILGVMNSLNSRGGGVNDIWSKRIDLLKKLREEYKKNIKTFSEEKSLSKVRDSYKEAFEEIFKGTGFTIDNIDINSERAFVASLESMDDFFKKAGNEIYKKFKVLLGEIKNLFESENYKKEQDELVKSWEDTVKRFNMTEELKKVGFGGDLLEDLVGGDGSVDVKKLQDELDKMKDAQSKYGEDYAKEVDKMQREVTEIIRKRTEERMKIFVSSLEGSLSQLAKIELDRLKEIKDFMNGKDYTNMTNAQQEVVMNAINKKFNEQKEKQVLDNFKGSDMFIMAIQNIERASSKSLEAVKLKLQETINTANNLSHTDLKGLVSDIESIENELMERNPFKIMIASYKQLRAATSAFDTEFGIDKKTSRKERNNSADDYIAYYQEQIAHQEEIVSMLELINTLKLQGNNADIATLELSDEFKECVGDVGYLQGLTNDAISARLKLEKDEVSNLKKTQQVALDYKKTQDKARKALLASANAAVDTSKKIGDVAKSAIDGIESLGGLGDGMGESFGLAIDAFDTIMAMIPQVVMLATSAGTAINMALGIIGLIAMAANAVIQIIKAVVSFNDNEIKRKIEGIQKEVDKLKESADELREAFDLSTNVKNSMANIKDLQENTERAIERTKKQLEEAKKIAKAKDREAAIEEATSQIEEVAKQTKEDMQMFLDEFGGVGDNAKSWLEDLVDSWYEAAMNGEDALGALTDKFDEFINNIIKKQLLLRGADKIMQPVFEAIDRMFDVDGVVDEGELNNLRQMIDEKLPMLNEYFSSIGDSLGGLDVSGLSDLQGSIQGMSESTAEVLAGYLNSIRFSVLTNQENVSQIVRFIQGDIFSPVVEAIRTQTAIVGEIRDLVNQVSITSGSGRAFRVVY